MLTRGNSITRVFTHGAFLSLRASRWLPRKSGGRTSAVGARTQRPDQAANNCGAIVAACQRSLRCRNPLARGAFDLYAPKGASRGQTGVNPRRSHKGPALKRKTVYADRTPTILTAHQETRAVPPRAGWCINRNEERFMRKLILAVLLGVSVLPIAPPAEAQVVVMRRHPAQRGRFSHRGRWYSHRAWRGGRWRYW